MNFVFRADASTQIGFGHIMRCRTLAQQLKIANHKVTFACKELPGNLIKYLRDGGFDVDSIADNHLESPHRYNEEHDATSCAELTSFKSADWIISDHYMLRSKWHKGIKQKGQKLFVIDDLAISSQHADLFLNQNVLFPKQKSISGKCVQLLGPEYALVRPEFIKLREKSIAKKRQIEGGQILLFMGGGAVYEETRLFLDGLVRSTQKISTINIVVGDACDNIAELQSVVDRQADWNLFIQTSRMAELLSEADLAITGGGSISWEKCVLGVPSLVAVLADNQKVITHDLQEKEAQITLGNLHNITVNLIARNLEELTAQRIAEMSYCASKICDGNGVKRVAEKLLES